MKSCILGVLILTLAACSSGGTGGTVPYDVYKGRPGYQPPIQSDEYVPVDNPAAEFNANITGMLTTDASQVEKYIQQRLKNYPTSQNNPAPTNYTEIARVAVQMLNADTATIEQQFNSNPEMLRAAMYVINTSLGSCFNGNSVSATIDCFNQWEHRVGVAETLNNADLLDISDADITTISGKKLKFGIDSATGKINSITIDSDSSSPETFQYENGNQFVNAADESSVRQLTYNSIGRDLGLSYSDFGYYHIDSGVNDSIDTAVEHNVMFAGGYDNKKINPTQIKSEHKFTGRAVGLVESDGGNGGRIFLDGVATLNFANATSTLTADFDNWYDVKIVQNADGTNTDMQLSDYKINQMGWDMRVQNTNIDNATMNIGYYGPYGNTGNPTEATGTAAFDEGAGGIKMDMAFGVKQQ